MNFIDNILLLEANSVSEQEYKELTGSSLDAFRKRMRQVIAETKAEVEAEKRKESRSDD